MANSKRQNLKPKRTKSSYSVKQNKEHSLGGYSFTFLLGAVLSCVIVLALYPKNKPDSLPKEKSHTLLQRSLGNSNNIDISDEADKRTVLQLLALAEDELEKVDAMEMSIAVAREVKGFEHLDYNYYNQLLDSWTQQFLLWLPVVEQEYYQNPARWKNDINFARLGALAQWLDQAAGVHYVPEHIVRQKEGLGVEYEDLGHMLVFGLIDTKEGTCATMPVLQLIMARKCAWPVSLICIKHHCMLRYDDGKNRYNLEATDTGRGGFAIATDAEVMEEMKIPSQAVSCGSDLRSLTNREMMAVFIAARARYYRDTDQMDLADRDYSLARFLFPQWRSLNYMNQPGYIWRAAELFAEGEYGHPYTMINTIYEYLPPKRQTLHRRPFITPNRRSLEEIERINEENQRRMTNPPPFMQNNPNMQNSNSNNLNLGHLSQPF